MLAICLPLAKILWQVWQTTQGQDSGLGANPIEYILRALGEITFYLLCLTLLVTPLRKITGAIWLLKLRRMLGVSTFAYATLHLLAYAAWDQGLDIGDILTDTAKRPFIFAGMVGWFLMLPLALTSFNAAIRFMGGKRWQWLHRAVYAVAIAATLHFWWMKASKNDLLRPASFALVVAVLLGYRVWAWVSGRRTASVKT